MNQHRRHLLGRTICRGQLALKASNTFLESHQLLIALVLTAVVVLSLLGSSQGRLFSYDEQVTLRFAQLPAHQIWTLFARGLDTTGPVAALAAHLTLPLPNSPEISLRIPFILAFAAMSFGLWAFLRTRYPAGFALTAFFLPLQFTTLKYFSTDARAYAFMLCATGMGIMFWQMAAQQQRRPWSLIGLWLVLALGISAHFFTIFVAFPFAVAQAVHDTGRKRLDLPLWATIVSFPLAWLPLAQGELRAHVLYAGTFWSKPTLRNLADPYEQMVTPNWTIVYVLLAFALCVPFIQRFDSLRTHPSEGSPATFTGLRRHEWALVLSFMLLPVVAWICAHWLGAFHHYYVSPYAVGMLALIVAATAEACRRNSILGLLFFVLIGCLTLTDGTLLDAAQGVTALFDRGQAHRHNQDSFQAIDWVRSLDHTTGPIAADNSTAARLQYYGSPSVAQRSVAVVDARSGQLHPGAMTDMTNMRAFGHTLGYHFVTLDELKRQRFLLVQQRTHYPSEWIPESLMSPDANSLDFQLRARMLASNGDVIIFDICPTQLC